MRWWSTPTASRWQRFWARASSVADGKVVHNLDRPSIENLDALPHVVDVYKRDLDVTRYNVPFLQHPYVALYTTRGCPAQCTFCLWPQTHSGHAWRKRSSDDIAAEMVKAKAYWPEVKEFFFDDDTFNIQKASHHRTLLEAEAAGTDLVLHLARDHRLRDAEGDEGCGLPVADRGL